MSKSVMRGELSRIYRAVHALDNRRLVLREREVVSEADAELRAAVLEIESLGVRGLLGAAWDSE